MHEYERQEQQFEGDTLQLTEEVGFHEVGSLAISRQLEIEKVEIPTILDRLFKEPFCSDTHDL